jgi:HSP20 family protein
MAIVRRSPLRDMDIFQNRLRRMFDDFTPEWPAFREPSAMSQWAPSVDVYETQNDIVVKAELPGVESKDVDVSFENNILTIRGERQMDEEVKEDNYHRVECNYGSFTRSFSLPTTVDENKVKAEFKNGILKITLPKREQAKRKQITVNAA